jgi:Flp pilus assembly protein TadG
MKRIPPIPKNDSRRGSAIVEFAFVAPLFLIMIAGVIEIGRAIEVVQLLTNASREGARVASFDSTTQSTTVTSAVNAYLSNRGITGATTTLSPNPPTGASNGQPVTVTVSIPFSQVNWLNSSFYLGGRSLQATSVMCRQPAP